MFRVKTLSRYAAILLATALPIVPVSAQDAAPAVSQQVPATAPSLIVAISIDQFSADIFAQYRQHFPE